MISVLCEICRKGFPTPLTLARHSYIHKDLSFQCDDCGDKFPFESSLKNHRQKHLETTAYYCNFGACNKWFKRETDLKTHVRLDSGTLWACDYCTYKNLDKYNLTAHLGKLANVLGVKCPKCRKRFCWTQQHKKHLGSGECTK